MVSRISLRKILLLLGDLALFYVSLFIGVLLGYGKNFTYLEFLKHLTPFSILFIGWLVIFFISDFYTLHAKKTNFSFYSKVISVLLIIFTGSALLFYLVPHLKIAPKTNLLIIISVFGFFFILWRKIFYSLFSSHFLRKVAIIGNSEEAQNLKEEIKNRPYLGYKVEELDYNKDIIKQIKNKDIETLILAENLNKASKVTNNLYQYLNTKVEFQDLSESYEKITRKIPVSFITKGWFLENLKENERKIYEKAKRIIDIILSFLILIITFPFWILIALAIKLEDDASVLYRQKRVGKNKNTFCLLKFRSMQEKAEDKTGPVWAKEKDKRITKVGKVLRRLHVDELPQMINILKGDISLIGPRPERPEFVKKLEKKIPHYHLRHLVKPGFTGWAQLKFRYGRSVKDSKEKFQYDLYYIKNRSFFLDFEILLKTFQLFFKK
ncbi:MAG: exopolysaccharide biosynthesis polyprenyl glycosylphosphotransferase [Minisyncoccales bacterium]